MLGPAPGLAQHLDHIVQCLARLDSEVVALEPFLGVPADHPADEHEAAARRDAVRVAARASPAWGLQYLHHFLSSFLSVRSRSSSRAMISCCTSVAPS